MPKEVTFQSESDPLFPAPRGAKVKRAVATPIEGVAPKSAPDRATADSDAPVKPRSKKGSHA